MHLISKPTNYRILELCNSLCIIRDCLTLTSEGKGYQYIPIFGQLRALVWDGKKTNTPLLVSLADLFTYPLDFYAMPDTKDPDFPKELRDSLVFRVSGLPLSLTKEFSGHRQVALKDYLEEFPILITGNHIKVIELIRFFAEKSGGAHYDVDLPLHYAQLDHVSFNYQSMALNYYDQLARLILQLGIGLIQKISNLHFFFSIYVPNQTIEDRITIFEYRYPNTNIGFELSINSKLEIEFKIEDLSERIYQLKSEKKIMFSQQLVIDVSFSISDSLNTIIQIHVNNEKFCSLQLSEPLQIRNDLNFYEKWYACNKEQKNSTEMAFGEVLVYGAIVSSSERPKLYKYLHMASKGADGRKYMYFSKGSFGYSETGTSDMKLSRNVHQKIILHPRAQFVHESLSEL